ncbi:MAG TPA: tetratricopeptide repeat protein [Gemmatimonadaceae bacterium]
MADKNAVAGHSAPAASVPVFIATFAAIFVAIGVLLSLDLFLAGVDRDESSGHAAAEYDEGVALLAAGRAGAAADRFRAAASLQRSNVNYALALGEAMLADGKTEEAEQTLRSLLERAGNDGAVNLTMARVMVRENRLTDAKAYYHRAVFGRWGADSLRLRRQARFELIDLLARRGSPRELLAELLPFEETSPDSTALRRRLGQLFILAGSPARGANMLREVLRRDPTDADAFAGMGEAALALGNFRTARADFANASRLRPDDVAITRRRILTDSLLELDPSARGIRSSDRVTRSRLLLLRTVGVATTCGAGPPARLESARVLSGQASLSGDGESLGEAMVDAANELWATLPEGCIAMDELLRLLHARLVQ